MLTIYLFQRSVQLNYCSFTLSVPYVCILLPELDILATLTTCKQSVITEQDNVLANSCLETYPAVTNQYNPLCARSSLKHEKTVWPY